MPTGIIIPAFITIPNILGYHNIKILLVTDIVDGSGEILERMQDLFDSWIIGILRL